MSVLEIQSICSYKLTKTIRYCGCLQHSLAYDFVHNPKSEQISVYISQWKLQYHFETSPLRLKPPWKVSMIESQPLQPHIFQDELISSAPTQITPYLHRKSTRAEGKEVPHLHNLIPTRFRVPPPPGISGEFGNSQARALRAGRFERSGKSNGRQVQALAERNSLKLPYVVTLHT